MIFIDTNAFVAYYNKRDVHHERSLVLIKRAMEGYYGKVFTSDYIFDESVTVTLVRTKDIKRAIALGEYILNSEINLLNVDEKCFFESWNLFEKVKMSFTDCTCLLLMKLYGIGNIMTFDMGFRDKEIEVVS
jgi:predicted nucleic acid-binding protein